MRGPFLVLSVMIIFLSCNREDDNIFKDKRDKNSYSYIVKGSDQWMSDNLKYLSAELYGKESWLWKKEGLSYDEACDELGSLPGGLYSFSTACQSCPKEWHIPSMDEWEGLIDQYDSDSDGVSRFRDFNLGFDGHAMEDGVFCLYEGDTFWTSDTVSVNSSYAIAITINDEGEIEYSQKKYS